MTVFIQILIIVCLEFPLTSRFENPAVRTFNIDGKDVLVTIDVDQRFIGKYSGTKGGYLLLNSDGTGEYLYDYFGYASAGCKPGPVYFQWGCLLNEKSEIIKFERDYGFSLPILYLCTKETGFQGCRKRYLIDYLLDLNDGTIEVSSSDDWKKNP